ncbi:desulfoferrodoxin FeS4 iron-binding domain-containing protein, partial [Candidatus Bathyarchaeota archaeon]
LCEICGNKVKVLENGPGVLVCCGQPMTKVE